MINVFGHVRSNSTAVTYQLLNELKVRVNADTIVKVLESHPEYPGLLAISDCLLTFGVSNQAYRIDKDEYNPADLLFPFIAYSAKGEGSFFLVKSIENGKVLIADEKNKDQLLPENEFLKLWEGIVLYVKPNEKSGEKDFIQNRINSVLQRIKLPAFLIVFFSLLGLIFNLNGFLWAVLILCMIKLIGVAVCILLLAQNISPDNAFVKGFCKTDGRNGCNSILKSKAAYLTSWLSWSEMGLFYFAGSFLLMLFFPVLAPVLSLLNMITLPFLFYSLAYQNKIKSWCVLCCTILALLVMECIVFQLNFGVLNFGFVLKRDFIFTFFICFLFPITIWGLLKPVLLKAFSIKQLQQQLNRYKYDTDLFSLALTNQQHYEVNDELIPVILGRSGDEEVRTVITIVSNLFCEPCKKAYAFMHDWLQQADDLQVKLLFMSNSKVNSANHEIVRHIMALSLLKDKNIVIRALSEWYNQSNKTYGFWAERYPVTIASVVDRAVDKQEEWFEHAEIKFTPAILINGYKLPEPYQLEDIKYLIFR